MTKKPNSNAPCDRPRTSSYVNMAPMPADQMIGMVRKNQRLKLWYSCPDGLLMTSFQLNVAPSSGGLGDFLRRSNAHSERRAKRVRSSVMLDGG